jgi:hypothetical protein
MLPFYLLLVLIGTQQSTAQNESGKRVISRTAFSWHWYDSTKHKHMVRVPIIKTLPPLSSDMPLNVLRGYIHLDSLARFNTNGGLVQFPSAWLAKPDLLKKTLASYYTVMDYDPLRYQQYDYETALKSELFRSELGGTTAFLPDALAEATSIQSERGALVAALFPDYVLRVKVLAVDSISVALPIGSRSIFNVTAQVLDTLKGRKFITCQEQNGGDQSQPMAMSALPCLYFQYISRTYSDYGMYNKKADSVFMDGQRKFTMRPGQETIVFLYFSEQKFDSTHDAFELFLGPPGSDATLPIVDGQVRDVNRIWSDEAVVTYPDWKRRFLELRDKILNGNY